MRGIVSLCTGFIAIGISVSASFGFLSNDSRKNKQNMFGGYGEIHSTGNYSQHFYYDENNFYYQAYVSTWNHSFFELYSYDFETNESYPVCKRISCSHKSAECHIHPCYQSENIPDSGIWGLIDNQFISLKNTKDKLFIQLWNPLTDTFASVIEIPRYNSLSDSQGLSGKYESFYNDAIRLNDDYILIGYNNVMHIYDNDFRDILQFSCNGLLYPLVVDNKLCWSGMKNELNCIDLISGETEYNLLDGLFETNSIVSVKETDYPFSAFVYKDELYFPRESIIYAFNPATHSLREIADTDSLSETDPYACFCNGNIMYYKKNGIVQCMNLDTSTVKDVPDLPKVPCVSFNDLLLFVNPDTDGENDIECYNIG